jgi:ATP-dependent DNA helicase RecQ
MDASLSSEPPHDPIGEAARKLLGVGYLYPIQRFVVSNVLEGNSQIVVLPTGAGKSLCFQLPALLLPGPTLVLMPLLSLLSDQARRLAEAGVAAGCLRGGLSAEEKRRLFDAVKAGTMRIILATPESCLVPANLDALHECAIHHLVVDEAHCISEWGDSFRPAYTSIGEIVRALGVPTVSAFTATASPPVIERIRSTLVGDGDMRIVVASADRPGISYEVRAHISRTHALVDLTRTAEKPLLVFCRTRNGTERAARTVRRRCPGVPVRFYHAGLSKEERADVEHWFLPCRDGVLFATCAYGLGVDKPDIRTIAHADIPHSVEAYLQESGRAGRDGSPARAVLLTSAEDDAFLGHLTEARARERFAGMMRYARGASGCRRNALLALIDQEAVACSGCDVCAGTAASQPAGAAEILRFSWRHRRRFLLSQAAAILCAEPGPRARRGFHDCVEGWGHLDGWTREEVEEGIHALIASGMLRLRARGPWKGRLTAATSAGGYNGSSEPQ